MEKEKTIGYIFLIVGVFIIIYAGFSVYQVFTNNAVPANLFGFNSISLDLSKMVENAPPNANLTQELIESEMLNKPMNIFAHLFTNGICSYNRL